MALEITTQNFENYSNSDKLFVVDVWKDNCGPCKMYAPIFEKFSEENQDVVMGKLDGPANRDILEKYEIRSVPTTLFIKDGELLEKKTGFLNKEQLSELINTLK